MATLVENCVLNIKTALAVDEVVGDVVVSDVVVCDVAVGGVVESPSNPVS